MKKLIFTILTLLLTVTLAAQDDKIPILVDVDDNKFTSLDDERQLVAMFRSHLRARGFNVDVSEASYMLRLVPVIESSDRAREDEVKVKMQIALEEVETEKLLIEVLVDTFVYGYIDGWDDGSLQIGAGDMDYITFGGTEVLSEYGRCFVNDITGVEAFLAHVRKALSPLYIKKEE